MFDFDASKLLIIGVVALIVIGPKDLPRVLRQVGQMVTKLRRMAGEFQGQFMEAMKEADLADLKNEVTKLKDTASLDVVFNPVADVKNTITRAVDGNSVALETPLPRAVNPYGQNPIEAVPSALADATLPLVGTLAASGPVTLTSAEPAHHTPAAMSGAVHAVEPSTTDGGRPRRILVPKRRPPGDRVSGPVAAGRGRSLLPPRRDPRP